ncbi:glutamate receptor 2-like [Tenebrio molitor]|uniref:glutamate receptor 2-like n=1 Tax=Tenebrio molitor TaxID=7067 RepID=UPI003624A63B
MKQVFFVILLATCPTPGLSNVAFLKAFFKGKNVAFTINTCCDSASRKLLVRELALDFQQVGFYKGDDTDILKHWSSNNYLVLDLRDCPSSFDVLCQLNQSNLFVYHLKYLILVDNSELSLLSGVLGEFRFLPNCELFVAAFAGESALLYQPYKVGKTNELIWENYGNWSLGGSLLEYYWDTATPRRRLDLKGGNLVVCLTIYDNDTLNHLTDYVLDEGGVLIVLATDCFRDPGVDPFAKQDFEPMMCVLRYMKINYSFSIVDNLGYLNKTTGIFSGMVREIQTVKADVSAGSIFFTKDRYEAVDMIKMGNPHAIRFVVRKPSTSYMKNIFFITFKWSVWVASAVFVAAVNIVLNWETRNKQKVKQNKYGVSDITLIALEAVCQQGTTTEPQSFAGRILALILFGAFMFIYVSYSANIVVLLQSTMKINDVQELLDSRIEAGGYQVHYMKNYFEVFLCYECRNEARLRFVGSKKRTFEEVENLGYIVVPKHSPYKNLFKVAILRIGEFGLQTRINLRVLMIPKCFSQATSFKHVGIYDCEQVIWIWIFGTSLAFVIFLFEKNRGQETQQGD